MNDVRDRFIMYFAIAAAVIGLGISVAVNISSGSEPAHKQARLSEEDRQAVTDTFWQAYRTIPNSEFVTACHQYVADPVYWGGAVFEMFSGPRSNAKARYFLTILERECAANGVGLA